MKTLTTLFAAFTLAAGLLALGASPVRAQDDDKCEIDMADIIDLTTLVQQQADEGDRLSALETLSGMQTQLDALFLNCTGGESQATTSTTTTTSNTTNFSDIELTQSISVDDPFTGGTLSLDYPADWQATNQFDTITLGNNDSALLASGVLELAADDVQVNTAIFDAFLVSSLGIELSDGPDQFIVMLVDLLNESDPSQPIVIGEVEIFDAAGRDAAITSGSATSFDVTYPLIFAAVDVGDAFILIGMFAGEGGDLSEHETLLRAIAASVEFEAVDF